MQVKLRELLGLRFAEGNWSSRFAFVKKIRFFSISFYLQSKYCIALDHYIDAKL